MRKVRERQRKEGGKEERKKERKEGREGGSLATPFRCGPAARLVLPRFRSTEDSGGQQTGEACFEEIN